MNTFGDAFPQNNHPVGIAFVVEAAVGGVQVGRRVKVSADVGFGLFFASVFALNVLWMRSERALMEV